MGADDAAEDAALLSRAVGKPVRVQWMRDDEHGWEPKGPAQLDLIRAGIDGEGKIIAWDFADRGFPLTAASGRGLRLLASRQIGMKPTADGNSNGTRGGGEMYAFENQKCAAPLIPWVQADETPLRTGYLRAPGDIARCFASESFMDEIAADLSVDPVQFRMRYLGDNKRGAERLGRSRKASPMAREAIARGNVVRHESTRQRRGDLQPRRDDLRRRRRSRSGQVDGQCRGQTLRASPMTAD